MEYEEEEEEDKEEDEEEVEGEEEEERRARTTSDPWRAAVAAPVAALQCEPLAAATMLIRSEQRLRGNSHFLPWSAGRRR